MKRKQKNETKFLVIGSRKEAVINYFLNKSMQWNKPFLFLSEDSFGKDWRVRLSNSKGYELFLKGKKVSLKKVTGIYARLMGPKNLKKTGSMQAFELLGHFLNNTTIRVVNRPNAMDSNNSKPYQTFLIRQVGLRVPETIITNSESYAKDWEKNWGGSIFKSISGVRSIVKKSNNATCNMWKHLKNSPTQFQKLQKGNNIRVHVIGDQVFPVLIHSKSLDYRYAERDGHHNIFEKITLPDKIQTACVQITKALGLHFSGIDLIQTENEGLVCLEVNPSPGYIYYEQNSDLLITEALSNYLENSKLKKINNSQKKQSLLEGLPILAQTLRGGEKSWL